MACHFTFLRRIKCEVEKVVWRFGSDQTDFVSQPLWGYPFLLPLHNQLALRYPLIWVKVVSVSSGDLGGVAIVKEMVYNCR